MQLERQKYPGVGPYERSADRQGHANGFEPQTISKGKSPITLLPVKACKGEELTQPTCSFSCHNGIII